MFFTSALNLIMAANLKWFFKRKLVYSFTRLLPRQSLSFLAGVVIGSGIKELISLIDWPLE